MAKINIDSMFEPIEFTLEGKDYKIEKISPDTIDKINSVDKTDPILGIVEQFSILTGIPKEEACLIDIRKIKSVIELIMKAITPGDVSKNA